MYVESSHFVASAASKICNKIKRRYKSSQDRRKEGDYGAPTLSGLPPSVLSKIMDELPVESQAMMQLVNRRVKKKLQGRHVNPNKVQGQPVLKRNILSLLDRDGPYPHCIVCPWCCKFLRPDHSVRQQPHSEHNTLLPCSACTGPGFHSLNPPFPLEAASPFLPSKVHFNMLAAIMKSHRTRHTRSPLAPSYSPTIFASTLNLPSESGIQIQVHHKVEIVGGSLLLKTEAAIYKPHHILTCGDVPEAVCLGDLFHKHRHHLQACQHLKYNAGTNGRLLCSGGCGNGCSNGCSNHEAHHQAASSTALVGRVFACPHCFTDMAVDVRDANRVDSGAVSPSRAYIFTSWKDLGKGEDVKDPKWQSHLGIPGRPREGVVRSPEPTVYKAFSTVRALTYCRRVTREDAPPAYSEN